MSERSIYLRDQADKCRQHASTVSDTQTREELRKLAAVYIARAVVIENKEQASPGTIVVGRSCLTGKRALMMVYQEKIAPPCTLPDAASEPADGLLLNRTTESLHQENSGLKRA